MNTQEDIMLLRAIANKDQSAFDSLFRKYYPLLCAYSSRLIPPEDAEDIVEDLMVWIWEHAETVSRMEMPLSSYLYRSVYNRTVSRIRHIHLKLRVELKFYEEMQHIMQTVDYRQIEELCCRIEMAVSALPDTYREAFTMHRYDELTYKEIAEKLGVSGKTIDYRITQALKILRIKLKEYLLVLL